MFEKIIEKIDMDGCLVIMLFGGVIVLIFLLGIGSLISQYISTCGGG